MRPADPFAHRVAWVDPTHVLVALGDGSRPDDPTERAGILLYDLTKPSGLDDVDAVTWSFPIVALDVALSPDRATAIVATPTGIGELAIATGCYREVAISGARHISLDPPRRRAFVVTEDTLARVELAAGTTFEVAKPEVVDAMAYDPTSDRLVVRHRLGAAKLFDPTSLVAASEIVLVPTSDAVEGGPWIRPGIAEAVFSVFHYCEKHAPAPPGPPRMRGPPCIEPPAEVGARLVRVELPGGRILSTDRLPPGTSLSDPDGSWSGDGLRIMVSDVSDLAIVTIGGAPRFVPLLSKSHYTWPDVTSFPSAFALDATGERFAGATNRGLVIVDHATGKIAWRADLPFGFYPP